MKYFVVILLALSTLLTACGEPSTGTVGKYASDVHRAVNDWQPSLEPAWTSGAINGYVYERLNVIANHQKAAALEAASLSDYAGYALTPEERVKLRVLLQPLLEEFGTTAVLLLLEHQP